jgi:small nuclear ribonucleoprotein (snRNP)-like protein
MNRILAFPLVLVLMLVPLARLTLGQQPAADIADVAKVKAEIARRNTGDKSNVTIKLRNGAELKGRITKTSDNMFTLKEDKTKNHRDLNYADVAKVKGRGLSRGAKFGILTAIVTGAVVIGALISLKHFDPFEHGLILR